MEKEWSRKGKIQIKNKRKSGNSGKKRKEKVGRRQKRVERKTQGKTRGERNREQR